MNCGLKMPLWSITIWDKKFNGVEKSWQPKTIKYKYLFSDQINSIIDPDGDVRILYTGKNTGFTNEKLAGVAVSEGEIVAIPWGGVPKIHYHKGKFVTGDNRIATSSDTNVLNNKFLYYYLNSRLEEIASYYRGASLKHPSMKDILKMEITIPSIKEQERINNELDNYQELIKVKEQELDNLNELVKSRFIEMFGNPLENDKGFPTEPLARVCPFNCYKGSVEASDGQYWLLNLDVIESHTGKILSKQFVDINEIGNSTITFDSECVLYSKLRPYLNKVVIPDQTGFATSELVYMKTGKKINKYFLSELQQEL